MPSIRDSIAPPHLVTHVEAFSIITIENLNPKPSPYLHAHVEALRPRYVVVICLIEPVRHPKRHPNAQVKLCRAIPRGRIEDDSVAFAFNGHVANPQVTMQQPRARLSGRSEDEFIPDVALRQALDEWVCKLCEVTAQP